MIIQGDCLEEMKKMNDCSIDFIVTDPPYGLHFMGKHWDKFKKSNFNERGDYGIAIENGKTRNVRKIGSANHEVGAYDPKRDDEFQTFMYQFGLEAIRILKPGSHIAMFGSTRRHHRQMAGLEDAGFELRDTLMWLFGQGFPKSHNKFGLKGYGTALKPAWEPIILAMKPLDGTYAQNVEKWNVGGINIDESRIETDDNRDRIGMGSKGNGKCYGSSDSYDSITNVQGRWPANLILDEEAAEMLDRQSGNNVSRFFKLVDPECFLCYSPCIKAKDKECKHIRAQDACLFSSNINQITESFVQKNAQTMHEELIAQNVKSAGNLCDLCAMNIAQGLVKIKNLDFKIEELQVILGYIGSFKKCILIQNLVLFVNQWDNIDTIPTTQSLSKLFGCVQHAIESYIKTENLNQNGKNEQLRLIYAPKASSKERNAGLEGMELKEKKTLNDFVRNTEGRTAPKCGSPQANNHPTVKPLSLMRYILKLLAPPGNPIMLDPFAGSGSTLCASKQLGIRHIGIELEKEYCDIAQKRLDHIQEFEGK